MGSWGVMSLRRLMVLKMVMMASWGATATTTSADDRLKTGGSK